MFSGGERTFRGPVILRLGPQMAETISCLSLLLALEGCIVTIGLFDEVSQESSVWFGRNASRSGGRIKSVRGSHIRET